MVEVASFQLKLSGGLADRHEMEGYDGFTALAGAAWTLSLVTNYVETGQIRHRGEFVGRHAVIATPMSEGSLLADFSVVLRNHPDAVFGFAGSTATGLLYGLVRRVINRNIGMPAEVLNSETETLIDDRGGDVEALVAATEPSLRRAHDVIGKSAHNVDWVGGVSTMAHLNSASKTYMKDTIPDERVVVRDVTVTGFLGNSGRGLVFDPELGRNISVSMTRDTLLAIGTVFSWGLDQYLNKTGRTIRMGFTRMLATDGRPKHYVVKHASAGRRSNDDEEDLIL